MKRLQHYCQQQKHLQILLIYHQQQWNHFGWAFLWFSSPIFLVSEIGVLIWNMCFIIYTQEIFTDMVLERLRQLHKGDNFINKFLLSINFCQPPYFRNSTIFELIISRITIWWQILLVGQDSKTLDTFETCI